MSARAIRLHRGELVVSLVFLLCTTSSIASADRYEATLTARPSAQLARFADSGTDDRAEVVGAGLSAGLTWGVRNWLDLGGELTASAYENASHDAASVMVGGNPRTGALTRTTRLAQLRGLATLRLGVAWVPTVQLALGSGGRFRSAARLRGEGAAVLDPDGEDAELSADLVAGFRLGLEHRVTPRWTIGASVGASYCFGIGAPDLQTVDAAISVAYVWYPLW